MGVKRKSRPRKWTVRETARLLAARKLGKTYAQCASLLRRTEKQVECKLYKMEATRGNSLKGKKKYEILWNEREQAVLRAHYALLGPSAIAQRLRRTVRSVEVKAYKLGLAPPKPRWCYADVREILTNYVPARSNRLRSKRTAQAISHLRARLRKLYISDRLDAYLRQRPGAPAKLIDFHGRYPPGLKFAGARLTQKGKEKRAREYIAREAEHERQEAAFKKWQARSSRSR